MNQVDVLVGQRIRALRCSRGLSQADLGTLVGVTFQQVQTYENGRNRVSASRLDALARPLDVPVCHFFGGMEMAHPQRSQPEEEPDHPHQSADLLSEAHFVSFA